jgi:hypothetical protein
VLPRISLPEADAHEWLKAAVDGRSPLDRRWLSYRIPPEDMAILGDDATVVNLITSNSATVLGYVENPLPAHTGYNGNDDMVTLMFQGSNRK